MGPKTMIYSKLGSRLLAGAAVSFILWAGGCGTTAQTGGGQMPGASSTQRDLSFVHLDLATPAPGVATIQLYRYPDETSLPVITSGTEQALALEFDLLKQDGKPLQIEFKHFTRRWKEDYLQPSEYMVGRQQDEILDYRRSLASRSNYVHYTYNFPSGGIQFKVSGNYQLTVTDPADGSILFQLPFLITEQSADIKYDVRPVSLPGRAGIWSQPIVYIDPDAQSGRDLFDLGACFVKNTRFDLARCSGRPSLFEAPYASFYLDLEDSFEPESDMHVLDLRELRRGQSIDEVRFDTTPYEVVLVPDQADLGATDLSFQNGQSSISGSVVDVSNPDIEAEYVDATFRYIPYRSERAAGDVILTGSFNRWVLDAANRLVWNEAEGLYEGTVLIKQGVHAYQYHISGSQRSTQGAFAPQSSYTALLYYFDPVMHVDRLIAVRSKIAP